MSPADRAGDGRVRSQYESYPYPARDPADEANRLVTGSPSHLLEIEHYVRGGRAAGPLKALVAGGGTGDGAIMLAQQLANRGEGQVTYVDLSAASLSIAQARAVARGLNNITFLQGSLLDLRRVAPGPYDYIDCCGVLHHLADPAAGLEALAAELTPDGGLGLMLYGTLGRTGVYPMQSALRRLAGDDDDAARVALARKLLSLTPDSNWLMRNPHLGDHLRGDDAGLYDLLLHPRDRAYLVPEVLALLRDAGLRLAGFVPGLEYDPGLYLDDEELRRRAARLPAEEQAALAEELSGAMKSHVFYAVRDGVGWQSAEQQIGPASVPVLKDIAADALAASLARTGVVAATVGGRALRLPVSEEAARLVGLIDGRLSLRQLHGRLRASGERLSWDDFVGRFRGLLSVLLPLNLLLLRDGGPPRR